MRVECNNDEIKFQANQTNICRISTPYCLSHKCSDLFQVIVDQVALMNIRFFDYANSFLLII